MAVRIEPVGKAIIAPSQASVTGAGFQAFKILHLGFIVLPVLMGLDKFSNLTTHWTLYVAPAISNVIPAATFLRIVGVVEVAAGLVVWRKPQIGSYVVAAWLLGIIGNLLLASGYYDVALRDFGLLLAALALGRLSSVYAKEQAS